MDNYKSFIHLANCYLITVILLQSSDGQDVKRSSFCETDLFTASCANDEVIMMMSAYYGRMERNICQISDMKLGCKSDKRDYMDNQCSGKRKCEFKIIDHKKALSAGSSCPYDLDQYLKVEYRCLKVVIPDSTKCLLHNKLALTDASGYLASSVTEYKSMGTSNCPYVINVPSGKELLISLYNFATFSYKNRRPCPIVADIIHGSETVYSIQLCKDKIRGELLLEPIFAGMVQMRFASTDILKTSGRFLLKYQLVGCQDPSEHKGNHIQREGNKLTVKCNVTGETRSLVCKDDVWLGTIQDCPTYTEQGRISHDFPVGILVIVAIGVALGVFLGGLLLILVAAYMRRKQNEKQRQMMYMLPPHDSSDAGGPMGNVTRNTGTETNPDCAQCTLQRTATNKGGNSKDRMATYYPSSNGDGSIKDYSLFEKNALHENKPFNQNITSSTRTLQQPTRSHMYELPKFTP